ncbi:hypothetical protein HPB50_007038 [Hyalomma asiaticum]|uniref:Uncharacterized protein n=1 Tax=Hyalomma asiaticum TaxID=266040 RepID=A0ACB7SWF5_HYAAI|nr:hypothetical protein HPB50_007038 [Hyalomma asiaticum]
MPVCQRTSCHIGGEFPEFGSLLDSSRLAVTASSGTTGMVAERYGNIISTKAILDKDTNKCKGYGFVDFESPLAAEKAVKALQAQGVQAQMAKQQEQDPTNLYMANLPLYMAEQDLEQLLQAHGAVISTRILRDNSAQSRGVGFARYYTPPFPNDMTDPSSLPCSGSLLPDATMRPQDVAAPQLCLPTFWHNNPQLWFAQVIATFDLHHLTSAIFWFRHLLCNLSPEVAQEVADVSAAPLNDALYQRLKRSILDCTTTSESACLRLLLTSEELGDRRLSQLLDSMRQLLRSSDVDSNGALFRELFL